KSRLRSRISPEIGGRVVEILHREGSFVEQNDVLIRLENTKLTAQLELAKSAVEVSDAKHHEACLTRDHALRELKRKRKLAQQNILSADVLDQLEVNYESSEALCLAAAADQRKTRATQEAAQSDLEKAEIRAPFAGVVAEVATELGEWVTPSPPLLTSPSVVDLIDTRSLYISAPMDEVDSGRIQLKQLAKISIDSRRNESFSGVVVRIAPYVLDLEAQNRTVEVEVEFKPSGQSQGMLPGTSADVELILETRPNSLRIPTSALIEGKRVLVFDDGELVEREIETGLRNWDYTEIRNGLSEGELIVSSLDRKEVKAGVRAEIEPDEKTGNTP
ncbi:MAG: efflux RND transporter periplasmic adaptor subunit, partial [Deltaproteobacteria bacterium]|nr:efflux RND transporter periplasmic adaptor subunit [Deltaproteobacteria bacterium]